jgi:cellobiose PTS system EIIC component
MNKLTQVLEEKFMPVASRLSENRYLTSLRDGLELSMPLMIVGSMLIVIAEFPLNAYQDFMISVFGKNWAWWSWDVIFPSTIGLAALFVVFGVAYSLAKSYNHEPLPSGVLAISAYFILLHQFDSGGFNPSDFGATGLFTGMLTAIITTEIYSKILDKKIAVSLPESVPSSVLRSFASLVPAAIIIPLFVMIRYLVGLTSYETLNNLILNLLQEPLTVIGTSLGGSLLSAGFFTSFFWSFGIHGNEVVLAVMQPVVEAAKYANLDAYKAGEPLPYVVTKEFLDQFVYLGGTGLTLPLVLMMAFRSKSQQLKKLGRLGLGPGMFNINEPIIFGLPIVMNPLMWIPFFTAPVVSIMISYLSMSAGLVSRPTGVAIPWSTPPLIGGFLLTNDVRAIVLQIVILIVSGLIYWPFFKVYDKKLAFEELNKI